MKETIVAASVLIICIMLIRRLCRGKISAGVQYMLWLIVALRLIMPGITAVFPDALPESSFSITNVIDKVERATQEYIYADELPEQTDMPVGGFPFLLTDSSDGPTAVFLAGRITWTWGDLFRFIWYIGMTAAGVWIIFVNIRFARGLRKSRTRYEKEDFKLPVYLTKDLSSPCLYGLPGRQAVYIPEDVAEDDEKIRHILTHEYCHYKHRDVFWSILRCVLTAVYWFHPLVWLAAVLSKQDCELACDEAALKMLGEEERIAYGKTLVALINRKTKASDIVCTATTMTAGSDGMKERIRRIADKPRRLAAVLLLVLMVVGIMVTFTFTEPKKYPEGVYLLEGEGAKTVTTECFQVTFPDELAQKVYFGGTNGTDIIVYHRDSDREIGRFCMMFYEEAMKIADERKVVTIGGYGSGAALHSYITGQEERAAQDEYERYLQEEAEEPGGVPGTDSNGDEITYIYEDIIPGMTNEAQTGTAEASDGAAGPIPAPEETEQNVTNLPFEEGKDSNIGTPLEKEDVSAIEVASSNVEQTEASREYLPNEEIIITDGPEAQAHSFSAYNAESEKDVTVTYHDYYEEGEAASEEKEADGESSQVYLPSETITETYIPLGEEHPCYLYIPADNTDASPDVLEEIEALNQELIELTGSVRILYLSRESMQDALNTLVKNRTPYVGDASKTSQIAGALPTASGLSYRYIEMETATGPYAVTLYYKMEVDNLAQIDPDTQFLEAVLMFSSIENLEECNIRISNIEETADGSAEGGQEYEELTYERSYMEELFGALYPRSETEEAITALYNEVLAYLSEKVED